MEMYYMHQQTAKLLVFLFFVFLLSLLKVFFSFFSLWFVGETEFAELMFYLFKVFYRNFHHLVLTR